MRMEHLFTFAHLQISGKQKSGLGNQSFRKHEVVVKCETTIFSPSSDRRQEFDWFIFERLGLMCTSGLAILVSWAK